MLYDLLTTIKKNDNTINGLLDDVRYYKLIDNKQAIIKAKNKIKQLHANMILCNDIVADIIDNNK